MIAVCLAGGCGWQISHPLATRLELAAEAHRAAFHDWIKPGRCCDVIADPEPALEPEPARGALPGGRARQRRHVKPSDV